MVRKLKIVSLSLLIFVLSLIMIASAEILERILKFTRYLEKKLAYQNPDDPYGKLKL